MKKNILLLILATIFVSACSLDINNDPNYPKNEELTAALIFPSIENALAATVGDQMFNYAGFFAQYFEQMPEANQYNELAEYRLDEGSNLFDRCYRTLYAGALQDVKEVLARTKSTADIFACTVLRAYALTLVIDNLNNAPYQEILMGKENPSPKWDNALTVYKGVLKELDDAEQALADEMTVTDPLLGGDIDAWIEFANALRLRWYLRMNDAGEAGYDQKLKDLVANDVFPAKDVAWDVYSDMEGQYNPWYHARFELKAANHCAAYPIVSYLSLTNDPRIGYAIKKNSKDKWEGQFPGAKTRMKSWTGSDWKNANVSTINYNVTKAMPVYLFTAAEVQFLIAEVQVRFNHDLVAAKAAYEAGIKLDFASRGKSDAEADAFIATTAISLDGVGEVVALKRIGMQKWVALFMRDHMEAWSEARRTDIPACSPKTGQEINDDPTVYSAGDFIVPAVSSIEAGGLIMRVPYPENARKYNPNTPATETLDRKVFFDKN